MNNAAPGVVCVAKEKEKPLDDNINVNEPEILVNLIKVTVKTKDLVLQFHPTLCRYETR